MSLRRRWGLFWQRRRARALYRGFVKAGDLVFDVGANAGSRTAVFSGLGARVVAVEPQQPCLRALYARFHADPRVTILATALGPSPGRMELQLASASQVGSLNPEFLERLLAQPRYARLALGERRPVDVTTLDALIARFGLPAFVKVDAEGFDDQVLRGLSRAVPACAFEFQSFYPGPARACIERLEALGGASYNYDLHERMRLTLREWVPAGEMLRLLDRHERDDPPPQGEVYARMRRPG